MLKKHYLIIYFVFIFIIFNSSVIFAAYEYGEIFTEVQKFDKVRGSNLANIRNVITDDILKTLTFDKKTIWPSKSKILTSFSPQDLIEYGKNPGLSIRKLQKKGYTGKGVSVALFDQPLLHGHEAYLNVDYDYKVLNPEASGNSSMHGAAVMSLLAGKEIGTAPGAKVYYYAYPSWLGDQKNEADLFYDVIERNTKLPESKKIRVISMSHCVDSNLKNYRKLQFAEKAARNAGIIVIDVNTMQMNPVRAEPFKDKDEPESYVKANWGSYNSNELYVPTGRTVADGYTDESIKDRYVFFEGGGMSWAVPYVAGVIAMGIQVDPDLTEEEAISYLYQSGYNYHGGKLINPLGFIKLVEEKCPNPRDVTQDKDYRYFLYNSEELSNKDLEAINKYYIVRFNDSISIMKDVTDYETAEDIYTMLKKDSMKRRGLLKGIQIFGTTKEVPGFTVHYKIKNIKEMDEGGEFLTDHFYSSFNSSDIYEGISLYDIFTKKLNLDLIPHWPVARLPLQKDEIAPFIYKFLMYSEQIENKDVLLVDFSSPIFDSQHHSDDTGIILQRLAKEFKLINKIDYILYGNKKGKYPVQTDVAGDFSRDNLAEESSQGVRNFVINSHGQYNNIDQYVVAEDKDKYSDAARIIYPNGDGDTVFRISLINNNTVNQVLDDNFYTLFSRACSTASQLNEKNLIHEAMANGKLMAAIAHSSIGSNNGMNVFANLDGLKYNNPAYNYLLYVLNLKAGNTISDSFYKAQKGYVLEALNPDHRTLAGGHGNYLYQLHNVLSQNYLGLLEFNKGQDVPLDTIVKRFENKSNKKEQKLKSNSNRNKNVNRIFDESESFKCYINAIKKDEKVFKDEQYYSGDLSSLSSFKNHEYWLDSIISAVDNKFLYLKLKYYAPESSRILIRLAGDAPGLEDYPKTFASAGFITLLIKIAQDDLKACQADLCIEVGDPHSIVIDNELTDFIIENHGS